MEKTKIFLEVETLSNPIVLTSLAKETYSAKRGHLQRRENHFYLVRVDDRKKLLMTQNIKINKSKGYKE
jgi:hypothetical protein